jgi:hypothetical protein
LPDAARRPRTPLAALLAALSLLTAIPVGVFAADPPGQERFMYAVGQVESNGRYEARNTQSGAIGKYQIMPANWRAWAKLYLGDADALPTPYNQEKVARAKFRALHTWLRSWSVVAHWWLTGSSSRDAATWSDSSTRYVQKVMTIYRQSGDVPAAARPARRVRQRGVGDASPAIVYAGGWQTARHDAYSGHTVRYAQRAGAVARFTFTGRAISWIGPKGPTRGRAKVYLDGRLVRTVDLRGTGFQARAVLFGRAWPRSGRHTIRIEVAGTPGRPMVAIDGFVVRT